MAPSSNKDCRFHFLSLNQSLNTELERRMLQSALAMTAASLLRALYGSTFTQRKDPADAST